MPGKRTKNNSFQQQNSLLTGKYRKVSQQRKYEKETEDINLGFMQSFCQT